MKFTIYGNWSCDTCKKFAMTSGFGIVSFWGPEGPDKSLKHNAACSTLVEVAEF